MERIAACACRPLPYSIPNRCPHKQATGNERMLSTERHCRTCRFEILLGERVILARVGVPSGPVAVHQGSICGYSTS